MPGASFDIKRRLDWFEAFVATFREGEPEDVRRIDLKKEHSLKVHQEALRLTQSLDIASELAACIHVAALYHDVGRFPQYRRFKTFRDSDSANHAVLGVAAIKAEGALAGVDKKRRALICSAIMVHNRKALPERFFSDASGSPQAIAAKAVRDCDKLDILRVMLDHFESGEEDDVVTLGLARAPDRTSPGAVAAVLKGRSLSYGDMYFVNDMKLLLASWVFDMNFPASREAFFERGHVERLFSGLPKTPAVLAARDRIMRERESLVR